MSNKWNLDAPAAIVTGYRDGAQAAGALMPTEEEAAAFTSPQDVAFFHEVKAHLQIADRRFEDAYSEGMATANLDIAGSSVRGLTLAGRAALWLRDRKRLRAALEGLDAAAFHAHVAVATRLSLGAGLQALDQRMDEARETYADAIGRLDQVGAVFDATMARLERATFLETSDDERARFRDEAHAALENLGARALLGFLEEPMVPENQPTDVAEVAPRT